MVKGPSKNGRKKNMRRYWNTEIGQNVERMCRRFAPQQDFNLERLAAGGAQGPAVWALRAQTDKVEYSREMRTVLESTPGLYLREGMVVSIEVGPNDEVTGVTTYFGITFRCRAAVLTTGTFMNGIIWVGRKSMAAGR